MLFVVKSSERRLPKPWKKLQSEKEDQSEVIVYWKALQGDWKVRKKRIETKMKKKWKSTDYYRLTVAVLKRSDCSIRLTEYCWSRKEQTFVAEASKVRKKREFEASIPNLRLSICKPADVSWCWREQLVLTEAGWGLQTVADERLRPVAEERWRSKKYCRQTVLAKKYERSLAKNCCDRPAGVDGNLS